MLSPRRARLYEKIKKRENEEQEKIKSLKEKQKKISKKE